MKRALFRASEYHRFSRVECVKRKVLILKELLIVTERAAGRSLTALEKYKLAPYIPQVDLDNAKIHRRVPWYLWKDFAGITRGNDIYFRPGYYDADNAAGIALLGHELVHVGQYRNGMNWLTYLWSARYGYMSSPYERAAYATQAQIEGDLSCGCALPESQATP